MTSIESALQISLDACQRFKAILFSVKSAWASTLVDPMVIDKQRPSNQYSILKLNFSSVLSILDSVLAPSSSGWYSWPFITLQAEHALLQEGTRWINFSQNQNPSWYLEEWWQYCSDRNHEHRYLFHSVLVITLEQHWYWFQWKPNLRVTWQQMPNPCYGGESFFLPCSNTKLLWVPFLEVHTHIGVTFSLSLWPYHSNLLLLTCSKEHVKLESRS